MKKDIGIKGIPIYVFRKTNTFNKPAFTYIDRVRYDEKENVTYCYMKRKSFITEILCILCIPFVLYFAVHVNRPITVYVPNEMDYYNGTLYTNIEADYSDNKYVENIILFDNHTTPVRGVDLTGKMTTIDIPCEADSITVTIESTYLFYNTSESKEVHVNYISEEE